MTAQAILKLKAWRNNVSILKNLSKGKTWQNEKMKTTKKKKKENKGKKNAVTPVVESPYLEVCDHLQ